MVERLAFYFLELCLFLFWYLNLHTVVILILKRKELLDKTRVILRLIHLTNLHKRQLLPISLEMIFH